MLQAEPPATSKTPASPRHPRLERAGLIALRSLGAVVALIALTVGTSMLVLRTDWAGERIRRQIVKRVNADIQGTIDIERLSFGGNKVGVWGVALLIAAMSAKGVSEIYNINQIDRGYQHIDTRLNAIGAQIIRK